MEGEKGGRERKKEDIEGENKKGKYLKGNTKER